MHTFRCLSANELLPLVQKRTWHTGWGKIVRWWLDGVTLSFRSLVTSQQNVCSLQRQMWKFPNVVADTLALETSDQKAWVIWWKTRVWTKQQNKGQVGMMQVSISVYKNGKKTEDKAEAVFSKSKTLREHFSLDFARKPKLKVFWKTNLSSTVEEEDEEGQLYQEFVKFLHLSPGWGVQKHGSHADIEQRREIKYRSWMSSLHFLKSSLTVIIQNCWLIFDSMSKLSLHSRNFREQKRRKIARIFSRITAAWIKVKQSYNNFQLKLPRSVIKVLIKYGHNYFALGHGTHVVVHWFSLQDFLKAIFTRVEISLLKMLFFFIWT